MIARAVGVIHKRIASNGYALECFNELVAAGCNADELLWRLAACSEDPEPESTHDVVGFDSRQWNDFAKQLDKMAGRIEEISRTNVRLIFNEAHLSNLSVLPVAIRNFAALLVFIGQLRWRTYWVIAKNRLIEFVFETCGQYRDKQVAELIAAVTGNESYTEHVHREWRRRNRFIKVRPSAIRATSQNARGIVEGVFYMAAWALLRKLQLADLQGGSVLPQP